MNLQEVGWVSIYTIDLVQDTVRWWAPIIGVMDIQAALNAGNFLTS